jgi:alanine-synthesizing transaminase
MPLLETVETFLAEYPDISATQFGTLFRNDPNFVGELKKGRSPRQATVEKLLADLADYRQHHPAPAPADPAKPFKREPLMEISKSAKLKNVCYDIRGPVLKEATAMEEQGHRIIKLNIGNPAPFGFEAPQEILADVIANLPNAIGYCDPRASLLPARPLCSTTSKRGLFGVDVGDIYIGNGVSELIVMAMQALLNNGDEMLIPAPDYPLWTAAVTLSGGTRRCTTCVTRKNHWYPDLADMEAKITPNTRGIVIINPNNPTGAVYPKPVLEGLVAIARKHNLIMFRRRNLRQDPLRRGPAHLHRHAGPDLLCITFQRLVQVLSRVAGFRSGWLMVSGNKRAMAKDYIEGLDMLASMRLCANVQAQHAIQTALGGYQSINDLIRPGGRLYEQT